MSNGPIEFMGESASREDLPATEMGGVRGLIQPELVDGAEAHSELYEHEKEGIAVRYGSVPLSGMESKTGELLRVDGEAIVDPHTGRVLDPADLADVTGKPGNEVGLSDLKPGD